jgi:hypothetical protein
MALTRADSTVEVRCLVDYECASCGRRDQASATGLGSGTSLVFPFFADSSDVDSALGAAGDRAQRAAVR